jgi:hypothetical protein
LDEGAYRGNGNVVRMPEVIFDVELVEVEGNKEGGEGWRKMGSTQEGYAEVGTVKGGCIS